MLDQKSHLCLVCEPGLCDDSQEGDESAWALFTCGISCGLQLNANRVMLFWFTAFYQNPVLKKEGGFSILQKLGMGKLNVALLSTKSENYFSPR